VELYLHSPNTPSRRDAHLKQGQIYLFLPSPFIPEGHRNPPNVKSDIETEYTDYLKIKHVIFFRQLQIWQQYETLRLCLIQYENMHCASERL